MKTTIEWFKPEEKTPKNGKVIALCPSGYLSTMNVYDGHFNCSFSDNFESEIDIVMWAYTPKRLEEIASAEWEKRYDEN